MNRPCICQSPSCWWVPSGAAAIPACILKDAPILTGLPASIPFGPSPVTLFF